MRDDLIVGNGPKTVVLYSAAAGHKEATPTMARSTFKRMRLRFVTVAALSFDSFDTAWSQSTCSSFNLTGGVATGIYKDLNIPINGKPSYSTTVDDVVYVIIYDDDDARRKLREEGGEEVAGVTEAPAGEMAGDVLLYPRTLAGDAMRRAEHAEGRSLAACGKGFWFNFSGANYTTYPWYLTPDCADHPADITEGWFEVTCDGCDPVATVVTIECAGDSDSSSGSLTAEIDPSATTAPTPVSSDGAVERTPSSTTETIPPTSGSVGTPVVGTSTPSPASGSAAAEGTSSGASGVPVIAGGALVRVVVSATIAVFAATSPFLVSP